MPPPPLTVLLTNLFVANNSGSETVTELYADGLRRAGHRPIIYAHRLGPQADRMRARGHVLIDRIAALPVRPDVIHAQHGPPAMAAIAALPGVPAVFLCHSAQFEVEAPPDHPQIRRFIAVDELCRDRCLARGVPPDRLSIELNPIDPARLHPRSTLPERPARALLLTKNRGHQRAIQSACDAAGIALEELGPATGRVSTSLEAELPSYDLVFATARMALEAAATGCAVIVCDARGFAGLLTEARLDEWRRFNFGAGILAHPVTEAAVAEALAGYDAADAGRVAQRLRADARLDDCIERLVTRYREAMSEAPAQPAAAAAALAAWMEENVASSEPRRWMAVAREMHGLEAARIEGPIQAAEARVIEATKASLAGVQESLGAMVTQELALESTRELSLEFAQGFTASSDRFATGLAELEARLAQGFTTSSDRFATSLAELDARLAAEATSLGARITELERLFIETADRLTPDPGPLLRIERLLRASYRQVVPRAIRQPLHDLRRRLAEGASRR